jgi:hypothetical protein
VLPGNLSHTFAEEIPANMMVGVGFSHILRLMVAIYTVFMSNDVDFKTIAQNRRTEGEE